MVAKQQARGIVVDLIDHLLYEDYYFRRSSGRSGQSPSELRENLDEGLRGEIEKIKKRIENGEL